ncbi:MAG: hypothetical protein IT328_14865 [Caldilineaceae bacterium]|nr:hypothetical protein [Caldilineaceae bacterium]
MSQEWLPYSHEYWGVSFDYPADWQVDVPDFESLLAQVQDVPEGYSVDPAGEKTLYTVGHEVKLYPTGDANGKAISLRIRSYTLPPGETLEDWVMTMRELSYKDRIGEGWTEDYSLALIPFPGEHSPAIDDLLLESIEGEDALNASIWIALGKVVYQVDITNPDPALMEIAQRFVSSLEFDAAKQQELAESAPFAGDISHIRSLIEQADRELSSQEAP